MRKSRPDATAAPRDLLAIIVLFLSGCARVALGGDVGNHPPELVGEWIDSAKTTPGDTSFWILSQSGDDGSRHRSATGAVTVRHYGYWYLQGRLSDAGHHAICFTNRPGRSAPSCRDFDLDSLAHDAGIRRRLVVHGYQGNHSSSDRVLLADR